jgi:hypothetical protein
MEIHLVFVIPRSDSPYQCPDPDPYSLATIWSSESEESLMHRWPHLARPGPQPHNRIPGTAEEAIAWAMRNITQARERRRRKRQRRRGRLLRRLAAEVVVAMDKDRESATALRAILLEVAGHG